jgi:hypothetical protein
MASTLHNSSTTMDRHWHDGSVGKKGWVGVENYGRKINGYDYQAVSELGLYLWRGGIL